MTGIWGSSFTIRLTAEPSTFLERVGDYADRQGYTDLDSDKSTFLAKRGWISGGWNWAATAPFDRLSIQLRGSVAHVRLSSARMLVLFFLVVPIWAGFALWWLPPASRLLDGLMLTTALYVLIQVQGSLRVKASLRRLATQP